MSELYIPKLTVKNVTVEPAIRVGVQGYAGTGKTHAALTFPNPFIADFDNNLSAYKDRDLSLIPFWDNTFVAKELGYPPSRSGFPSNKRDAFIKFLREEAIKFTNEQTLVVDSWTSLQEAIDDQNEAVPKITDGGKIDSYAFWRSKLDDSRKIMSLLKSLKCNVFVTFHEVSQRDPKTGALLDKIRPLQQGSFLAELAKNFTFFFRSVSEEVKDKTSNKVISTKWLWQVASDNQFDAVSRPAFPDGVIFVEPHYNTLKRLMNGEKNF